MTLCCYPPLNVKCVERPDHVKRRGGGDAGLDPHKLRSREEHPDRPIRPHSFHSHYSPLFNIAFEIDVPAYLATDVAEICKWSPVQCNTLPFRDPYQNMMLEVHSSETISVVAIYRTRRRWWLSHLTCDNGSFILLSYWVSDTLL